MQVAELTATRSKDKSKQVGAVIVKDKHILSTGYNGAPAGFPDNEVPITGSEQTDITLSKHSYMIHAEVNAILNYKGALEDLKGATVYVTLSPCFDCAKLLIQAGIKTVIYKECYHKEAVWNMSKLLFDKCGVSYRCLEM